MTEWDEALYAGASSSGQSVSSRHHRQSPVADFASIQRLGYIPMGGGNVHNNGRVVYEKMEDGRVGITMRMRRKGEQVYMIAGGLAAGMALEFLRCGLLPAYYRSQGAEVATPRGLVSRFETGNNEPMQVISSNPPGMVRVWRVAEDWRSKLASPTHKAGRGYGVYGFIHSELTLALMNNNWLGLRLLVTLKRSGPTSASELINLIPGASVSLLARAVNSMTRALPQAQIDFVMPALAELKDVGVVELYAREKFYCTSLGRDIVQSIEDKTGSDLESQFNHEASLDLLEFIVPEILEEVQSPRKSRVKGGAGTNVVPAPDSSQSTSTLQAKEDMNYVAYTKDVPSLLKRYGAGIVAYANGRFVAWGESAQELARNIRESDYPREYALFIKEVPEAEDEEFSPAFEDA